MPQGTASVGQAGARGDLAGWLSSPHIQVLRPLTGSFLSRYLWRSHLPITNYPSIHHPSYYSTIHLSSEDSTVCSAAHHNPAHTSGKMFSQASFSLPATPLPGLNPCPTFPLPHASRDPGPSPHPLRSPPWPKKGHHLGQEQRAYACRHTTPPPHGVLVPIQGLGHST